MVIIACSFVSSAAKQSTIEKIANERITKEMFAVSLESFRGDYRYKYWLRRMNRKYVKEEKIKLYRVSHFNVPPQITFLFLILEKDVSDKSCMVSRGT